MENEASKENQYEEDWKLYQEFLKACEDGTIDESNPVYQMIVKNASRICEKERCNEEQAAIVLQNCFFSIAKGQYKRRGSLAGYIRVTAHRELINLWRENSRSIEIGENPVSEQPSAIAEAVVRKIASEKYMKALFADSPQLRDEIINAVTRYEKKKSGTVVEEITRNTQSKQFVSSEQADLLHQINNIFPLEKRQRYNELYARFKNGYLAENEYEELLELSNEFEILNANRLDYIGKLAELRGESLEKVMELFEIANSSYEKEVHFSENPSGSGVSSPGLL